MTSEEKVLLREMSGRSFSLDGYEEFVELAVAAKHSIERAAVQAERERIASAIKAVVRSHFEPCSCTEAYTSRKLTDPSCHYCFYFPELEDELVKEALTETVGKSP